MEKTKSCRKSFKIADIASVVLDIASVVDVTSVVVVVVVAVIFIVVIDNHILNEPLGCLLCSLARTTHSAHSLRSAPLRYIHELAHSLRSLPRGTVVIHKYVFML